VAAAGDAGTTRGSGGMVTKLEAARMCMAAGIPMVICHGRRPDAISAIVSGRHIGTIFDCDHENRASARRLWLALAGKVKGSLIVDTGAEKALRDSGSSLLAVGIREVWGDFKSDSAVDIRSLDDTLIGRGLSAYSSEEALKAAGLKSIELKDYPDLKHLASTPVVHRDQLVIF
jgi:glutamate 5-kinase